MNDAVPPAQNAYDRYQSIRDRLPREPAGARAAQEIDGLLSVAADYDLFLFDAYGVLNVGNRAIPGTAEVINTLRAQGKHCLVLSNAAGFVKDFYVKKQAALGYHFAAEDIVTGRDSLLYALRSYPDNMRWGVIDAGESRADLGTRILIDQDDPGFSRADGYLFLSTHRWDVLRQQAFVEMLLREPRPILLGNPDLIAPLGGGQVSIEAGSYVLLLPDKLFHQVRVFGKPFACVYDTVAARLRKRGIRFDHRRTLMLGDTLHTDILGGNAYGISTALLTGHGFFKDLDWRAAIADCGITPDFVLPQVAAATAAGA